MLPTGVSQGLQFLHRRLDEHSGPLKLWVSEDKRPARSMRNLVTIELKMAQ
jgi:hypothetical protein